MPRGKIFLGLIIILFILAGCALPNAPSTPTNPTKPPVSTPGQGLHFGSFPINRPSPTPTTVPTAVTPKPNATTAPGTNPLTPSTALPSTPSLGYLTNNKELAERKLLAAQGKEPHKSAVNQFLSYISNQKSDAPSPQEPLDIPDTGGPFRDDTAAAYDFALAYGLTNDIAYAQKARTFINAWVQTTKTTRNTCRDSGSCQTSLIIGRTAPGFVFAADLIKQSGVWSANDDQIFKSWLRNIILPTASERSNNWGDAGTFMRVVVSDYIGDTAEFEAAIVKWKAMIDPNDTLDTVARINDDGSIPEETRRGPQGIDYTQEALQYKLAVAFIAARRGVDIWSFDSGRLKRAVDYVAPFVLNPSTWPWANADSDNVSIYPLWEIAYQKWQDSLYKPVIQKERPWGYKNWHAAVRWATLTNGEPF